MEYGFFSIIPPLVSLILAIYTRNILLSLVTGTLAGWLIFTSGNPLTAIILMIEKGVFGQLTANSQIIAIILIIGGFIYLLENSGGTQAFGATVTRWVKGPKQAQLAVWCGGIAIFFTDSGNSLILGPLFRPIFRQFKICKEKLAYIIDSTASPVCVLVPFISWGVYSMGLIEQSYQQIGIEEDSFYSFIKSIPFAFYPIFSLIAVPIIILVGRDIGPMARAQYRFVETLEEEDQSLVATNASALVVVVPLAVLLLSMTGLFMYHYSTLGELKGPKIRSSLAFAYLCASLVCIFMMHRGGIKPVKESFATFRSGMERMLSIAIILIFAWSLGNICKTLDTGKYLSGLVEAFLTPMLLPVVIFVMGAVISFATGSSWGTFAILMPIAIPVAHSLDVSLYVTIGAVLSGGLFGDHTSPISDTTLLASLGAGCAHIDHVKTQLLYAYIVAAVSVVAFFVVSFYGV